MKIKSGLVRKCGDSSGEEELKPTRVKTHGTDIASGTAALTLVATDGMGALDLVAGDLLLVEKLEPTTYTFEIVQVSANPTVNTSVTVTRGAQGTSAAIIPANSFLLKIGTAFAEGTGAPKATNRNPTKYFNYTQIFKTVYEMTGTAEQTNIRTGDPLGNDKKRRMFDHSTAQELGYLFGFRHETTGANGKPLRYTGGLYQFLAAANTAPVETIKIWTAMPDEDDLLDAVYPVFDYNAGGIGNERIALCGNGFLNYLNILVKDQSSVRINYNGDIKYFGMQLQKWTFPQGTIYLKTHPLMSRHSLYTYSMWLLDFSVITWVPMRGRDTRANDNVQAKDEDLVRGQWETEASIMVDYAGQTLGYIGGFNTVPA